jgi:hypothetical protein
VRRGAAPAAAGLVLGGLLLAALLAPFITPFGMDALDLGHRRAAPSVTHWFGTDELGRDLLTRVLFGARISLAIGLVSAAVSTTIGVTLGAVAGVAGGWVDDVLMRLTDAMVSIPRLPLLMIAAAIVQPSVPVLVVLVGAAGWMETARVVRAEVQSLAARDHVAAARALGDDSLPNRRSPYSAGHAYRCNYRDDAGRGAGDSARERAELLRCRRAAPNGELGQHAISGSDGNEHRAVARRVPRRVHLPNGAVPERAR